MTFFKQKYVLLFSFVFVILSASSQKKNQPLFADASRKMAIDTVNIYHEMLRDISDDLMENHPADDLYNNIWTRERVNPYKMSIDSLPDSVYVDCSQFVMPVPGYVTSQFGPRRYRYHYGTDLKVQVGDSVRSSFSGKIRIIDFERKGYGNYVVIRHNNGLETVYAHLSKVMVEHDQEVKAGEVVALGGNTGRSTGPHLHYEIRYIGNAINPASIIDFEKKGVKSDLYLIAKAKTFKYKQEVNTMNAAKYYTARKGDTLARIASRNGTSVKALCSLNKIKTKSVIRKGQRIRIR